MSDLIKREDAIRAVAEVLSLNRFASFKDIKDFGRFAERMLRNVPSADRPQGEWVEVCKRTEQYDREGVKTWAVIYQCPTCGFVLNAIENHTAQYNYCPSCGCRMKGASR